MSDKIIELTVESLQNRFDGEINAFQPKGEDERFVLKLRDTTVMIDAAAKTFTPLKRGSSDVYMALKKFFSSVGLEYQSASIRDI